MNVLSRWRAVAVAAAVAPVALFAGSQATASAQILRTATTTSYNTTTFLHDDLGFPTTDTSPVIQPVTYDEFQWLLQQSGNSAFLVGDPATDTNFKAEAQEVETEAETLGVSEIYWFDPNLSGGNGTSTGVTVGSYSEPNLDIRNPAGITSLTTASQTIYGYAWDNVISQYLGDGIAENLTGVDTENATVNAVALGSATATYKGSVIGPGNSVINDYGTNAGYSTSITNGERNTDGGALYDYTGGAAPATVSNSYFFIYNKANTVTPTSGPNQGTAEPEKILAWINLDTETTASNLESDVAAAINTGNIGATNLTDYSQFNWWNSEGQAKNVAVDTSNYTGLDQPLLTPAANSPANGGWRIDQITYPELVDLLKNGATSSTAVILFGGTWCPNTRPVIPFINQYAQQNNTEVFNFDTVLDGGTVGGSTTGSNNPLQSRNSTTIASAGSPQSNPTFLYGDLVNTYLKNIDTQYTPTSSNVVTYYPGGNTTLPSQLANKLQVPFLIGYQAADGGGVNRQWIINNGNGSFTEYMSDWDHTDPQPNEMGLSTLPLDLPIWTTLNAELATVEATPGYAVSPSTLDTNSAIDTDDAQYLDSNDYAAITFTGTYPSVTAVKSVTDYNGTTPPTADIPVNPTALSAALAALGSSAPVNLAAAKTALIAAYNADAAATTLSPLTSELETIVGAWGVAQNRKTSVNNAWGNATTPSSVLGGLAADNALNIFFGGLPGGVVSTQTVTANTINYGADLQINVATSNAYGNIPTGNVTLTLTRGGTTVATQSTPFVDNLASFQVPIGSTGTYGYTVSYAGDNEIIAFTQSGTITVPAAPTTASSTASASTTPLSATSSTTPVTVTPAAKTKLKVSRILGVVFAAPRSKAHGKYQVTIATPNGLATATGRVKIKLEQGSSTKTLTGELQDDRVLVSLPKLATGKWKVGISWAGDTNYLSASGIGAAIKVAK